MTDPQPNKPDGELDDDKASDVDDRRAVEHQDSVEPDDYSEADKGSPDYGGN